MTNILVATVPIVEYYGMEIWITFNVWLKIPLYCLSFSVKHKVIKVVLNLLFSTNEIMKGRCWLLQSRTFFSNLCFICLNNLLIKYWEFQNQMIGVEPGVNTWSLLILRHCVNIKRSTTFQEHFRLVGKIVFGKISFVSWQNLVKRSKY